jgi:hypothetical protein
MSSNASERVREEFDLKVDAHVGRLSRAYRNLLSAAEVRESAEPHHQLQALTAAAEIAYNCQALLKRTHELRLHRVLASEEKVCYVFTHKE